MLPGASPVCFRKMTPISLPRRIHPRPGPGGIVPSVMPQSRRRRRGPDAACSGLGDAGALGGDAEDDKLSQIPLDCR